MFSLTGETQVPSSSAACEAAVFVERELTLTLQERAKLPVSVITQVQKGRACCRWITRIASYLLLFLLLLMIEPCADE